MSPHVWLLPGMDGTGRLFDPLLPFLGAFEVHVASYPLDAGSYDACEAAVGTPPDGAVIVGESFGGPLALRLAGKTKPRAVVIVASFVLSPRRVVPPRWLVERSPLPPRAALRYALLEQTSPDALVDALADSSRAASLRAMGERLAAIASVDVRDELQRCPAPITWLVATRDRLVRPRSVEAARRVRPDLVVREIDGPHLLAQTRPREVAQAIEVATGFGRIAGRTE